MTSEQVYVSITGFRLRARRHMFRFWWHTIRSMAQARRAPGNVKAEARLAEGVYHTLSVWADERAMRAFLLSGSHRQAMRAFRAIGSGQVLGFHTQHPPDWEAGLRRWRSEAREV